MSVHRAGSFFGVPHSTLEYKVKEQLKNRKDVQANVTFAIANKKNEHDVLQNQRSNQQPQLLRPEVILHLNQSLKQMIQQKTFKKCIVT